MHSEVWSSPIYYCWAVIITEVRSLNLYLCVNGTEFVFLIRTVPLSKKEKKKSSAKLSLVVLKTAVGNGTQNN